MAHTPEQHVHPRSGPARRALMSFTRCCRLASLLIASSFGLNLPAQTPPSPPKPLRPRTPHTRRSCASASSKATSASPAASRTRSSPATPGSRPPLTSRSSPASRSPPAPTAAPRSSSRTPPPSTSRPTPRSRSPTSPPKTACRKPGSRFSPAASHSPQAQRSRRAPTSFETPTDAIDLHYGDDELPPASPVILDAMQFTPHGRHSRSSANHVGLHAVPGHTYEHRWLRTFSNHKQPSRPTQLAFDNWVTERVDTRDAAMKPACTRPISSSPSPRPRGPRRQGHLHLLRSLRHLLGSHQRLDAAEPRRPFYRHAIATAELRHQHSDQAVARSAQRYTVSVSQLRQSGSQTPSRPRRCTRASLLR